MNLELLARSLAGGLGGLQQARQLNQQNQHDQIQQMIAQQLANAQIKNLDSEALDRLAQRRIGEQNARTAAAGEASLEGDRRIDNTRQMIAAASPETNLMQDPQGWHDIQQSGLQGLLKMQPGGMNLSPSPTPMTLPGAVNVPGLTPPTMNGASPAPLQVPAFNAKPEAPGAFRPPTPVEQNEQQKLMQAGIAADALKRFQAATSAPGFDPAKAGPQIKTDYQLAFPTKTWKDFQPEAPNPIIRPGIGPNGPGLVNLADPAHPQQVPDWKPQPTAVAGQDAGRAERAKNVSDAILRGDEPPTLLMGMGYTPEKAALASEIASKGGNVSKLITEWNATQRAVSSLNGPQPLRLRQAINKAIPSLDLIDTLSQQVEDAAIKSGRFPIFNKIALASIAAGGPGWDENIQSLANQLQQQIADVTGELGQVIMGGYAPTDHGLELAAKNLNANWTGKTLHDAVLTARRNLAFAAKAQDMSTPLGIGSNSLYADQVDMGKPNPVGPAGTLVAEPTGPPAKSSLTVTFPDGNVHTFSSQAALDLYNKSVGAAGAAPAPASAPKTGPVAPQAAPPPAPPPTGRATGPAGPTGPGRGGPPPLTPGAGGPDPATLALQAATNALQQAVARKAPPAEIAKLRGDLNTLLLQMK